MQLKLIGSILAGCAMAAAVSFVWAAAGVDSSALRKAVTVRAMRAHQAALQSIADANGGTRASGTPGFDASASYVKRQLETAGYTVIQMPFKFRSFRESSPSELQQVSSTATTYSKGIHFDTMQYSGAGNITAPLQNAGGIIIPPTPAPSSASGCDPADFAGFVAGRIALIQRGTCTFAVKAANAKAAGASAAIIFNEGNPGRTDVFIGTLGGPVDIPVLSAKFGLGSALAALSRRSMHLKTDTTSEIRWTSNLMAQTAGGRPDRVVVAGAHLDSVAEGPGIHDNGSGSAAILEIALQMKALGIRPRNKVRFMWFGAEEQGLLGSQHYVASLTERQMHNIALNLNFDMIASPNYVRFVYDGDGSATPQAGPSGSAVIEKVFLKYFARKGLATKATAFDGRSDYGPFIDAGIPAGGLFTGAEGIKTTAEAATYGGTAGVAYDSCYHRACDTYANNNRLAFGQMADAAADAVLQFAMTTSAVKGTSRTADAAVAKVDADSLLYKGSRLQR
jgi:Zn-dependent M28 family amino/carboxypeptidase